MCMCAYTHTHNALMKGKMFDIHFSNKKNKSWLIVDNIGRVGRKSLTFF